MRRITSILLAFTAGALLMYGWIRMAPAHLRAEYPPAAAAVASADAGPGSAATATMASASDADWPLEGPTPEQVLYAQPQLVRQALQRLTPRVAGRPNLYLVAFAGDGGEAVFRNEADYAARLFASRYGATAHSLVLENHASTLASHPLASWSNLEAVLDGIRQQMKPEQDILMLYVTSHGGEDHSLLVDMDPLPLDQIDARDLAGILAEHRFRWKVVVVNACYSGGFVDTLRQPGTLVITSAAADRSSFGCGSAADITYFGQAWLVDALNRTRDFVTAFQLAHAEIEQWEQRDKLTPSQPQMAMGAGIEQQLARWRSGSPTGPGIPFLPRGQGAKRPTAAVR
jgi:hypothetical protein